MTNTTPDIAIQILDIEHYDVVVALEPNIEEIDYKDLFTHFFILKTSNEHLHHATLPPKAFVNYYQGDSPWRPVKVLTIVK